MELENIKREFFDKLAGKPDTAAMFIKNWRRYRACVQFLEKNNVLKPGSMILDYGCGHPIVSAMLIKLGYTVVPYEPFAGEDEFRSAELLGVRDKMRTELSDETFDLVLMIDVIEHLSIIKPVMQDVAMKTASGGILFISTPNVMRAEMWLSFVSRQTGHPQALNHYLESDNNYTHHQREFTVGELVRTVKHFGFSTTDVTCVDTRPPLKDINALRREKGLGEKKVGSSLSVKKVLQKSLIALFPKQMNNNILLLAKKR